jgi:hypothetical protein
VKLSPEYFAQAKQRALRFSGCLDAGTSGALAGDVMRLLAYIDENTPGGKTMKTETETETISTDWILQGEREMKGRGGPQPAVEEAAPRLVGDGLLSPEREPSAAERLLSDAIETTAERRAKYAPPLEHFARTIGAINAIFAHKIREPFTPGDWAIFMQLDKFARHQGQPQRDNQLDAAGYAACWAEADPQP